MVRVVAIAMAEGVVQEGEEDDHERVGARRLVSKLGVRSWQPQSGASRRDRVLRKPRARGDFRESNPTVELFPRTRRDPWRWSVRSGAREPRTW